MEFFRAAVVRWKKKIRLGATFCPFFPLSLSGWKRRKKAALHRILKFQRKWEIMDGHREGKKPGKGGGGNPSSGAGFSHLISFFPFASFKLSPEWVCVCVPGYKATIFPSLSESTFLAWKFRKERFCAQFCFFWNFFRDLFPGNGKRTKLLLFLMKLELKYVSYASKH